MEKVAFLSTSLNKSNSQEIVGSSSCVPRKFEWTKEEDCIVDYFIAHINKSSINSFEELAKRIPEKTTTQILKRFYAKGGVLDFFEVDDRQRPSNEDVDIFAGDDKVVKTRYGCSISNCQVRSIQEQHRLFLESSHPLVAYGENKKLASSEPIFLSSLPQSSRHHIQKIATSSVAGDQLSLKRKNILAEMSSKSSLRKLSLNALPPNAKCCMNTMSFFMGAPPSNTTKLPKSTSHLNARKNLMLLQPSFPSPMLKAKNLQNQSYSGMEEACLPVFSERQPSKTGVLAQLPPSSCSFPWDMDNSSSQGSSRKNWYKQPSAISNRGFTAGSHSCTLPTMEAGATENYQLGELLNNAKMSGRSQKCCPHQLFQNHLQASNGNNLLNNCTISTTSGGSAPESLDVEATLNYYTNGFTNFLGNYSDAMSGGNRPDTKETYSCIGNENPTGSSIGTNRLNPLMVAKESATIDRGSAFKPWIKGAVANN